MSHIYSAYRLLTTCIYVHVRKGACLLNYECKISNKIFGECKKCELLRVIAS